MLILVLFGCPDSSPPTDSGTDGGADSPADETGTAQPVPPTLSAIDPPLGDTLGGVEVEFTGTGLGTSTIVTIGCEESSGPEPTRVVCVAPALEAGLHDVVVTTPEGVATLPEGWEAWSPVQLPEARGYTAAAGVTLDEAVGPMWMWTQEADEGPWHPRDGAGLLWFADKLWLLGGWYGYTVSEWHDQNTTNEVWSSDDLGATWFQEAADDPDPPTTGPDARWLPRHTVGWLVHEHDGIPYLYVVGGDAYHLTSDVWRSADGLTWEEVTADAPWAPRGRDWRTRRGRRGG